VPLPRQRADAARQRAWLDISRGREMFSAAVREATRCRCRKIRRRADAHAEAACRRAQPSCKLRSAPHRNRLVPGAQEASPKSCLSCTTRAEDTVDRTSLEAQINSVKCLVHSDECPYVPGLRRDDWLLPDPKGQGIESVRQTRHEIKRAFLRLMEREQLSRIAVPRNRSR
jgi:hypothetical protein